MKIKVSVPATSANVGSGFDALGLAVTLYNTVTFEENDHLEISSADGTRIPRNESNLVYRSANTLPAMLLARPMADSSQIGRAHV